MMKLSRAVFTAVLAISVLLCGTVAADTGKADEGPGGVPAKISIGARPIGQIAFINEGNIWIMDTDGGNRRQICAISNARGRLSFSPDNKIIAFAREGKDANNLPSGEGGMHLLHDIFLAYIDSAATRPGWWIKLTDGLGGNHPEWSYDGSTIYFQNDINAAFVDYFVPSHQIASVEVATGKVDNLRQDYQSLTTSMLTPTVSKDGSRIAYVIQYSVDPDKFSFQNFGINIVNRSDIMLPEEKMRSPEKGLAMTAAPSWSPDGKWLAYISTDMRKGGIYIVNPDDINDKRLIFGQTLTQLVSSQPVGWSPDSKWIVFVSGDGVIYTIDINGENLTPLSGAGNHSFPTWSK